MREDGALIDKLALTTNSGFTPSGIANTALVCNGPSLPGAPTGVTATPGNGQVMVSWNRRHRGHQLHRQARDRHERPVHPTSPAPSTSRGPASTTPASPTAPPTGTWCPPPTPRAKGPTPAHRCRPRPRRLPPTWTDADVGAVGIAGSSTINGGTITVRGAGADIAGTADAFHFLYQTMTGNGSITARITSITGGDGTNTAKVGVMMRDPGADGQGANDVNAFTMIKPAATQNKFQRRLTSGGTTTSTTRHRDRHADLGAPHPDRQHLPVGAVAQRHHLDHHRIGHGHHGHHHPRGSGRHQPQHGRADDRGVRQHHRQRGDAQHSAHRGHSRGGVPQSGARGHHRAVGAGRRRRR